MDKKVYILAGEGSSLSPAVTEHLLLEEFSYYRAVAAGLTPGDSTAADRRAADGGVFVRADAEFDSAELAQVLAKIEGDTALVDPEGNEVGYVVAGEIAETLDIAALSALPRVTLQFAERITAQNSERIMAARQAAIRQKYKVDGVFFEGEATLSPLYIIGKGTFVGTGTVLAGTGKIGEGCALVGACRLKDVTLGAGVTVTKSVLLEAEVGDKTTVGPFAYLRPNTHVGKGARIGDFVEIKNSVIDDGTKVSHLTYIGDSDVGKAVNFGCGTVTSNYDGLHKYRTVIGDNAFIGCNTNLVAPVTVGDNVYIAAGSTITDDIPAKSLAIARERQVNKTGWVEKNKPELIK